MKKKLKDLYDGICAVLKAVNELREVVERTRDELQLLHLEFTHLKAEMEALGEAADAAVERVNLSFQKELEAGFGYNPYDYLGE